MPRDGQPREPYERPLLGLSQRVPPGSIEAEQALLGALLANNKAYERVCDFLRAEHFLDPINGRIYRQIEERLVMGRLADAVTLRQDFENTGLLDEVGGAPYLARLLTAMVGIISAGEYGRSVHDGWIRRGLIDIGEDIVNAAFGAETDMDGPRQIEAAERALAALAGDGHRRDRTVSLGAAVQAAVRQAEAVKKGERRGAVQSGLRTFDKATGGLAAGNLILLGGVPGAGKTALAVQVAYSIAKGIYDAAVHDGATPEEAYRLPGVAVFSLEMSAEELALRVAAWLAGISVERLARGDFDFVEATRLADAECMTANLPLRIIDARKTSVRLLGARTRMHMAQQPEAVVMVDHLLQLEPEPDGRRGGRVGEDAASVRQAAKECKTFAGDFGVPFLVLSHVTRASTKAINPRPTLTDLKWGGEGDADTVMFVHRPVMFMDGLEPQRGGKEGEEAFAARHNRWRQDKEAAERVAELVVPKRRMGAPGVWKWGWNGATTSFFDFDNSRQGETEWPE